MHSGIDIDDATLPKEEREKSNQIVPPGEVLKLKRIPYPTFCQRRVHIFSVKCCRHVQVKFQFSFCCLQVYVGTGTVSKAKVGRILRKKNECLQWYIQQLLILIAGDEKILKSRQNWLQNAKNEKRTLLPDDWIVSIASKYKYATTRESFDKN